MTKDSDSSSKSLKLTRRGFLGAGVAATAGVMAGGLPHVARAKSGGVVTIYSADGLKAGNPSWYNVAFKEFTKQTGIDIQYVSAGSAGIVNRALREKYATQADVLITLPPFIQKAAQEGVLTPYESKAASAIPASSKGNKGDWYAMVDNYTCFIYNTKYLDKPPATYKDLLDPKFKGKLQYSTPGEAGDGTSFMLLVFHAMGRKAGLEYFSKLQSNNVGPSASTGRLAPLVNKGELWVANGDVQMNFAQQSQNPNLGIFWLANEKGVRAAVSEPYSIGLVNNAPHAENGKKFLDFMLSKQMQSLIPKYAYGLPSRSDVHPTGEHYKKLQEMMDGVKLWTPDWNHLSKNIQSYVQAWRGATL